MGGTQDRPFANGVLRGCHGGLPTFMNVRFLEVARQELLDAVAWYNDQVGGLGQEFLDELDRAIRRTATFPLSCPEIETDLTPRRRHAS